MFENPSATAPDHGLASNQLMNSVAASAFSTPRIDSSRLLSGGPELVIEHAGQEYRLRLTRNDKLILTK